MKIVEFFGGPGAGKTHMALSAHIALRSKGLKSAYCQEYATDLIMKDRRHLLDYQFIVAAGQFAKYKELERLGTDILLSDTSLLLCKAYGQTNHNRALWKVIDSIQSDLQPIKVFIRRVKPFSDYGRLHTLEQAKALDAKMYEELGPFDLEIDGSNHGFKYLMKYLKEEHGL